MTDSQSPEALSFALSQEELYVVLSYLKMPAPIELDDFEQQVFQNVPAGHQTAFIQIAERGLLARDYLSFKEDHTLALNTAVAQVIEVCSRPEQSWIVLSRRRDQTHPTAYYFHRRGEFFVSHATPLEMMHEFVVFQDTLLMRQAWLDIVQVPDGKAITCEPGTIPPETFGAVTDAQPFVQTTAAKKLTQAGLPKTTAERLAESLAQFASITIFTRLIHPPDGEPQPETGATVVTDNQMTWLLEHQPPNNLSVRSVAAEDFSQMLERLLT